MEWTYGCVFCVTGKERDAAQHIEQAYGHVRTMVARRLKLKTVQGRTHPEEEVLYPGYVFIKVPSRGEMPLTLQKDANIISLLTTNEGEWRLYGNDARVVQWLFSYDGLIAYSQAYQEGDQVRIISGPLKDLAGQIVRLDKRHKGAQVAITFCNREIKIWLRFEIVDKF